MRFIDGGPIIPNELLTARDEGQVIFFCGSGVSRAKACLPDFYGLAEAVLGHLHASPDSRARAVIEASKAVHVKGVEGLIPADRAFSLLEQEFDPQRVREAVAASLVPRTDDLSAHAALLELARGTDGEVRLVTTNFDRLFERCEPTIASHAPPDLPRPSRPASFKGIMHLHGVLDEAGRAPPDDDFFVSSADFGRAYLSEGWATQFIRSLMERFQIVFVGYTANDPPVQYLLEALNTRSAALQPMFALQAGDDDLARALWQHKNVTPIPFDPADKYRALWETIDAWAERARDPQGWMQRQIAVAGAGPQAVGSRQRGVIAHIAATLAGAREIARAGAELPAEWLCVLDSSMRFRSPAYRTLLEDGEPFDPFAAWGLDDDKVPPPFDTGDRQANRSVPAGAANPLYADRRIDAESWSGLAPAGLSIVGEARLPERLGFLANWVTKVAHEPVALWWASGKHSIDATLAKRIGNVLDSEPARFPDPVRRGWRQLLAAQAQPVDVNDMSLYAFDETRKAEGWSPALVRRYGDLRTPRLSVRQSWSRGAPPAGTDADDLMFRDVYYPNGQIEVVIPPELDEAYLRALGGALDRAIDLETDLRSTILLLGPLVRDPQPDDLPDVGDDITALFRDWIAALEGVLARDPGRVKAELPRWTVRPNNVGRRVRIWSVTAPGLLDACDAAAALLVLDEDGFWDGDHQRDLLHALADRWGAFDDADRGLLEDRLRAGPPTYDEELPEAHRTRVADAVLERLEWLHDRGCAFGFDYDAETRRLREALPSWQPGREDAAASTEIRSYTVGQRTDYDGLLDMPVARVAATALEQDHHYVDMKTVLRSFLGLARKKPVRALAALRRADTPASLRLWEEYLHEEEGGKPLSSRLVGAIGCTLAGLADDDLLEIIRPTARWTERYAMRLLREEPDLERHLWDRLLDVIEARPDKAVSAVITSGDNHDWLLEAINSPTGRLAEIAVQHSADDAPEGALSEHWMARLRRLTAVPGDAGRYALVLATQNLRFFAARAPDFAAERLLSARAGDADDQAAFWAGVFRAQGLTADLHRTLNADIVQAARAAGPRRDENSSLSALLLRGWNLDDLRSSGDAITDDELRETILVTTDAFRQQLLLMARRSWSAGGWPERALYLLRSVWPRQRAVRSIAVSEAVASLIVDAGDLFPEAMAAAGDLLDQVPGALAPWTYDIERVKGLADKYPEAMLDFLSRVLSEDAANWPYRVDLVIGVLEQSPVAADSKLQELRRRWSARGF